MSAGNGEQSIRIVELRKVNLQAGWEASWADVITQGDYVKEERKWLWEAQQLGGVGNCL